MKKNSDYLDKIDDLSSVEVEIYANLMRKRMRKMGILTVILFLLTLTIIALITFIPPVNKDMIKEFFTTLIIMILVSPFPFIFSYLYCKKSDKELALQWFHIKRRNKSQ